MPNTFALLLLAVTASACLGPGEGQCVNGAERTADGVCRHAGTTHPPEARDAGPSESPEAALPSTPEDAAVLEDAADADAPCTSEDCFACETHQDCASHSAGPFCAPRGDCVECLVNDDCTDPARSTCDPDSNTCETCASDAHCTHLDAPYCSVGAERCVQCIPGAFAAEQCEQLNGLACDPQAFTCSGQPLASLAACGRSLLSPDGRVTQCGSDDECTSGYRCVPTRFAQAPHGNYCLPIAPQSSPCAPPWPKPAEATSLSGIEDVYCFPRLTTCEAIADLGHPCATDDDCGREDQDDGICEGPDGNRRCSYSCSQDSDCKDSACVTSASRAFCNPN